MLPPLHHFLRHICPHWTRRPRGALQGRSAVQRVFPCSVKAAFLLAGLTWKDFSLLPQQAGVADELEALE